MLHGVDWPLMARVRLHDAICAAGRDFPSLLLHPTKNRAPEGVEVQGDTVPLMPFSNATTPMGAGDPM